METDLQQLQGTWQALKIETAGRAVPVESVRRLRYISDGDRVTIVEGDGTTGVGIVALDPEATPKALDVLMTEGAGRGRTALGIS